MKKALICGVGGQDGSYLAHFLLAKGYEVHGTSRDAQVNGFVNLKKLGIFDRVFTHSMAVNDFRSVLHLFNKLRPDEIYNLSGQSSVGLSFDQPVETMESISLGVLNMLEAIRFLGSSTRFYNAGSSECFGDTGGSPANETTPFRPRSPYAVAKAAAHWQVVNYREAYNLFACNGILFNHESCLRPERFVTRKIIEAARGIHKGTLDKLVLGNTRIIRDWGWAPEYVKAMWMMLQAAEPEDFVVATGQSISLDEFVSYAFEGLGLSADRHIEIRPDLYRPNDLMASYADPSKAEKKLNWKATVPLRSVVRKMIKEELF